MRKTELVVERTTRNCTIDVVLVCGLRSSEDPEADRILISTVNYDLWLQEMRRTDSQWERNYAKRSSAILSGS